MIIRLSFIATIGCLLAACCPTGTTVVLIPDAGGKVGQVELRTKGGTTQLSKANESASAINAEQSPTQASQLSEKKIHDMFAETLAKEPTAPIRYALLFLSGSADLTADASVKIPEIIAEINARKSCDVSSIGHTDTTGTNESNQSISVARAETVRNALINAGINAKCIDSRNYGESDLFVKTADNVNEPLNRRVEVEIR